MQRGVAERNRDILAERRIEFRIGINIGDVIVEKGDVFGDGVNIAARLEQIAPPGGICLSEDAYRQVRGKLDIPIADAGEQHLKNIASPVRAFRIEPSALAAFDAPPPPDVESSKRGWSTRAIAGAAVTAAVLLAAGGWFALTRDRTPVVQSTRHPSRPPSAPMPVIAVLPFANQTGDGSQEYFADGVTEEVINALGRFNTIRVIGRNAVLRYKKQPPTQDEITSGLGASYLVSGSVRRSGQQVRITAQLAQARDGTVMWSDRYDGEMTDIFDFQDTIARRIAGTLAANITHVEARRQLDQPPRPNRQRVRPGVARPGDRLFGVTHGQSPIPGVGRQGDRDGPELCCRLGAAIRRVPFAGHPRLDRISRPRSFARRCRCAKGDRARPQRARRISRARPRPDGARRIRAIEGCAQTSG